jgi:RNA polymerase sigma-70 factor (ECF subfamily)
VRENKTIQEQAGAGGELIEMAKHGDLDAFQKLVDLYSRRVHSIAYQLCGNSDDAEDISQEVFLRLYNSFSKYDSRYMFMTWLYRLTVNLAIDFKRKNARHRHSSIDEIKAESDPNEYAAGPDKDLERSEFKGAIKKLAGRLAENQRKVFVLRDLQEFSVDEIATVLGCRASTVRVHLARARANLKKSLLQIYPELVKNRSNTEINIDEMP